MGLRVVFFGTNSFAKRVLEGLVQSPHEVVAAVTAPDAPSGRGRKVSSPPVAEFARARGLTLLQPEGLRSQSVHEHLRALRGDIFAVASYGLILPAKVLAIPPLGAFNAHASLLPALRGAAPIERAILVGLEETGVTIQKMTTRVDAGDIYAQERLRILPDETAGELSSRLAELAARLLPETLSRLERGEAVGIPQDERLATSAPPIEPHERAIRWSEPAVQVVRRVRAMAPERRAYAMFQDGHGRTRRLVVLRAAVAHLDRSAPPGTILEASEANGLIVACGEGAVELIQVQPEGKNIMSARDFLRGSHLRANDRLLDGTA